MKKYHVAVVGGHGLVATSIIEQLNKCHFPLESLTVYGSLKHSSIDLIVEGKKYNIVPLTRENIQKHDIVFFSSSEDLSSYFAPFFIDLGARIIDNSSFFRLQNNVPLVIPEINEDDLFCETKIYANPNCTTIMILLSIFKLHQYFHVEKLNISTYQSISGAGKRALEEYELENKDTNYEPKILPSNNVEKKLIYNNILPIVDDLLFDGYTKEEIKIIKESQKILHNQDLEINPTCVRIPVTVGHGASINAICREKIDLAKIKELYLNSPYILLKENKDYPDLLSTINSNKVIVGRLREDKYCKYTLNLFVTSNNLIRGASYNAVQIALSLIKLKII